MNDRYLGVDLGTRRIGLAIGEAGTGIASPLVVLQAKASDEENARVILDVADEYDAGAIVIGLPLNMDGSQGPQARKSEALARTLRRLIDESASTASTQRREILFHDERLTSAAADERLAGRELTHKKKKARHDALAAQVLLQSFFESRRQLIADGQSNQRSE